MIENTFLIGITTHSSLYIVVHSSWWSICSGVHSCSQASHSEVLNEWTKLTAWSTSCQWMWTNEVNHSNELQISSLVSLFLVYLMLIPSPTTSFVCLFRVTWHNCSQSVVNRGRGGDRCMHLLPSWHHLSRRVTVVRFMVLWLYASCKLAASIGSILPLKHLILIYTCCSFFVTQPS